MKLNIPVIAVFMTVSGVQTSWSQDVFSDYFTENRLRFDFFLAGNRTETHVYPAGVRWEPHWGGSRVNLLDTLNFGNYRFEVADESTGEMLYCNGFCTLFQEWQTTAEARSTERAYYQAVFFPFPQRKVRMALKFRDRNGIMVPVYNTVIDPVDYFIQRDMPEKNEIIPVLENGDHANHVDLLFLAEGYSAGEREKFSLDVSRLCNSLFAASPFSENREKFNVAALWTPSVECGTDIPGEMIYKNTRFSATFYTFNLDRYLTTSDMKSIYDEAAGFPWDHLIVLVNTQRYGGGGFYNFLTVCSADNELTPRVLVHELGHAFAGLGDEYYLSSVAYEDYYNTDIEPWEPNLTTLKDFTAKWKSMIHDTIPVPTPRIPGYKGVIGVFEGGGYKAKGIFSPAQDCRMKSNNADEFCPVCKAAIRAAIEWHTR